MPARSKKWLIRPMLFWVFGFGFGVNLLSYNYTGQPFYLLGAVGLMIGTCAVLDEARKETR